MRAQELHAGDEERLAVIGKRQVFGPNPLIGLVLAQLAFSRGQKGKAREQEKGDQDEAEVEPFFSVRSEDPPSLRFGAASGGWRMELPMPAA